MTQNYQWYCKAVEALSEVDTETLLAHARDRGLLRRMRAGRIKRLGWQALVDILWDSQRGSFPARLEAMKALDPSA